MNNDSSAVQRKSPFALLGGIIVRPGATLTHLKANQVRSWWVPAVLVLVLTVLPFLMARPATSAPVADMPIVDGPRFPEMGPGPSQPTRPAILDTLQLVGRVLGTPLTWLFWAGALYLAGVFLGRSSSFKSLFRLTVWCSVPFGVRGLLQTLYLWLSGQSIVNPGFSGYVFDRGTPLIIPPGPGTLALASILGRVDLFLVWQLLLLGLGLSIFTNLPRRKSLIAVIVVWAALAVLAVIPAVVGGMFTSAGF